MLQYYDGTQYRDIPGAKAAGNLTCDWNARFAPVVTGKVRLLVTATPGDLTRIWELELYSPPADP